jgi:hypothetical protein
VGRSNQLLLASQPPCETTSELPLVTEAIKPRKVGLKEHPANSPLPHPCPSCPARGAAPFPTQSRICALRTDRDTNNPLVLNTIPALDAKGIRPEHSLNNTLFNNQWIIEKIREEIKKFLECNENENTAYQNIQDTAKAVLRGKFIAITACIKNTKRSQINNLMPNSYKNKNKLNPKQSEGDK